jgi:hypothetical protein
MTYVVAVGETEVEDASERCLVKLVEMAKYQEENQPRSC